MGSRNRTQAQSGAPRVTPLRFGALDAGDTGVLVPGGEYDGFAFDGVELPALPGATLLECVVTESHAERLELRGARVLQTRLLRCTAPVVSAQRSTWRDVELFESRLGAVELTDADVQRVVITDSKVGWVNLRASSVRDVLFRNCTFDEVDLGSASVSRVAFEACTAERLVLTQANAAHLDLRGLDFRALEGFEGLRGSMLTPEQMVLLGDSLAAHFGITIAAGPPL